MAFMRFSFLELQGASRLDSLLIFSFLASNCCTHCLLQFSTSQGEEEPSKQYKKMVSNSTFYTQSTRTVIHYVIWSYMFTGAEEKTICRNVTQPISTEMASGINILTQNSSRNNKKEGESNVHLTWLYFGGFYTSV